MNENVNVCITPKGDKPVLHFSQFDNENVFTVTVFADDGETAAVLTGLDIEFRIRKTDSHIVTIAPESVTDNVITFKTTEQLCACCGQNIATVTLMKDDLVISTLDILVEIQRDIMSGGLQSESDIRNLTTQIETIIPEVLADDYYTKDQVDEIIADIPTFDPTNYYDKSDVDGLLADKADSDDVYTKAETDSLLSGKADADDVYTKTETDNLLADKADIDDVMVKITRHGIIGNMSSFTFTNNCIAPMDDIECKITHTQSGSGTPSPSNPRPITGHSSCTITVADSDNTPVNTVTVSLGTTVFGGSVDVTGGVVEVTDIYLNVVGSYFSGIATTGGVLRAYTTPQFTDRIISACDCLDIDGNSTTLDSIFIAGGRICVTPTWAQSVATVDDFKTLLASNPINIVINAVTPTELTFTPATTDTINGTNKVSSSTGNMKSLTYFSDVNSDLVDLIRACMI